MKHIAFFDSGVGGLTVLNEALSKMPQEHFIYYADTDHVPYGTKSKEEILQRVLQAAEFLSKLELKALVVACNTATSVAINSLRASYDFPIIGMEPAVKPGLQMVEERKVLVCATDRTLEEEKLHALVKDLKGEAYTTFLSLQALVGYAENKKIGEQEVVHYLKTQFKSLDWSHYDALVLGCTHFSYYTKIIEQVIPKHIAVLDGNAGTVKHLMSQVTIRQQGEGSVGYYQSGKKQKEAAFDWYLDQLKAASF